MATDNIIEFLIKGDASSAQKSFGEVDKTLGALTKVVGALGLSFSAIKFAEFIGHQIDVADKFKKMSEKTGIAVDTLSQLDHAFALSGLSSQDMETSFRFLNKTIDEAKLGNIGAMDSFASLGISLKDLKTSAPLDVMYKLADAFTQIEDPTARTTMLVEKFGRSGLALAPAFSKGAAGIKELMKEADNLGLTIDTNFAKAAEDFNDNMSRIGAKAAGAGRQIAATILPVLNEATVALFDFGKSSDESIVPWGKVVVTVIGVVSAALVGLKTTVTAITDSISTAFKATGELLGAVGASAAAALEGDLGGATATLKEGWNDLGQTADKWLTKLDADLQRGADGINKIDQAVQNYGKSVDDAGNKTEKASKHKLDPVSQAAAQRLDALRKKLQDFESAAIKATAAASGNKLAVLDAEYQHQLKLLKDMEREGANTARARLLVETQYAAQRIALQDEMLGMLGISDASYRERQIQLAQQTADRMIELGLSQVQAEGFVNQTRLAQQQQFLAAKQSAIDESWLAYDELAIMRDEQEQVRLLLALENRFITKQQYDQLDIERETKKQAALGNIQAQAEANRLAVSKMSMMQQLQYTSQSLGAITSLMQSENKKQFQIGKAAAIAQAIINTYTSAVNAYQSASAIPVVGWILGPIAAAAALALGLQNVNKIRSTQFQGGQAHDGLTDVPREGTYLLDKGERVLSPEQNRDLTGFMSRNDGGGQEEAGGGVSIGALNITIQVPNGQALRDMSQREWEDITTQKIVPALNVLNRKGVRPDFVQRYDR